jgi:hypothetical protein
VPDPDFLRIDDRYAPGRCSYHQSNVVLVREDRIAEIDLPPGSKALTRVSANRG